MSNRRRAFIDFCDSSDVSRYLASFPPAPLFHIFTNQYVPSIASQQSTFLDKVGHWRVRPFAGFQLTSIHFISNIFEGLPTISAVVYMYTNPCSSMSDD